MKILALIPARGGSKRLPGKNIRSLGGVSLIERAIAFAKGIDSSISDILVSTDNSEIASIANKVGALVPWLRPNNLATDTASSVEVALHALDWYQSKVNSVDGLLLLQPTSPFRKRETAIQGLSLFSKYEYKRPVVSVSPIKKNTDYYLKIDGDKVLPYFNGVTCLDESNKLDSVYDVNGAFYLISPALLRQESSFSPCSSMIPLVMRGFRESLDIDTPADWRLAEAMLSLSDGDS